VSGFSAFEPQAALFKRVLLGFAEEQQLDGGGRVLVSPALRRYAGLDKDALLLGQGSHLEIWNPEALDRQLESLANADKLPPGLENFTL
jgi:MraZ protein